MYPMTMDKLDPIFKNNFSKIIFRLICSLTISAAGVKLTILTIPKTNSNIFLEINYYKLLNTFYSIS